MLDQQISPGLDFETGMLLGIPVLNQHSRVTIDYPHHLLTFEDPKLPPLTFACPFLV